MAVPRAKPQAIRLTDAAAERIKYVMANAEQPITATRDSRSLAKNLSPTSGGATLELMYCLPSRIALTACTISWPMASLRR